MEAAGGKDYIGYLVDAVPTAANVEYHAEIVREKAILRSLIQVSTSIVHDAFAGQSTAADLLDQAESKIFQVSQQRKPDGFMRIKELLWPTMERIEALQRGGKTITGVASGFEDLDDLTSGFQPSDLVIVFDDLDLPLGKVRARMKGSAGGHHGVRSVIEALGTDAIRRVKVGIGRPAPPGQHKDRVVDHVLSPFYPDEREAVEAACAEAVDLALKLVERRA